MLKFENLFRSRVARHVFLQFVLCALLPLSILSFAAFERLSDQMTRAAFLRLGQSCKESGMVVAERIGLLESELHRALFVHSTSRGSTPAAIEERDGGLPRGFLGLTLVENGVSHPLDGAPSALPVLDELQQQHLLEKRFLVAPVRLPGMPSRVFMIHRDLRLGEATIYGEIDEDFLWPRGVFARQGEVPAAIYDRTGPVVEAKGDLLPPEAVARALDEDSVRGQFSWAANGQEFVGTYWTLFLVPQYLIAWTLISSESMDSVMAPIDQFRTLFGLFMLLTFLAVTLLSMTQVRRSLTPIAILREGTRRIAEGDLNSRIHIDRDDEFGDLGQTFNRMADRIHSRTMGLERANKAKGDFLANMSHEIRTPMTSILGYAKLCLDSSIEEGQRSQNLHVIQDSGEHLLGVLDDILDMTQVEAGRLQVSLEPCSPGQIALEVVSMLEPQAQSNGLTIRLELEGPIPEVIPSDPKRLRQILLNLLGNALKFTEAGEVVLSLSLDQSTDGAPMTFVVEDSGIGMPEEVVGRIFEAFAQADTSMSRRFGGTGLGLTISRALARLLGGDITCNSRVGEGSRFTLTVAAGPLEDARWTESLPGRPASRHDPAPALPSPAPKAGVRVLLAEDVRINRLLVTRLLERLGAEVEPAENGRVAFDKARDSMLRGQPFDLILMDIQMPEMDGYEATRRLRQEGYTGTIVALTSHSFAGEREKCLAAGCDHFENKPIAEATLAKLLEPDRAVGPPHTAPTQG